MKKKKLPELFPASLGLLCDSETHGTILSPVYRRYKDGKNEEFDYFIDRIMAAMYPRIGRQFSEKKDRCLISDVYTVHDKAYALLVIYNEIDVWNMQATKMESGKKGTNIRKRKKFCDGTSGNRQGWTRQGLNMYNRLCRELAERREESKEMEMKFRERFVEQDFGGRTNDLEDNEFANKEWFYAATALEERLKRIAEKQIKKIEEEDGPGNVLVDI